MQEAAAGIDVDRLLQSAGDALEVSLPNRTEDLQLEGLTRLVAAIERGIDRNVAVLRVAKREIYAWALSYAGLVRDLAAHPEIVDVPVPKPLFLVGFGRTGSTLLHNLLALSPEARAPRLWEIWSPSPPPRAGMVDDPRIEVARQRLAFLAKGAPLARRAHPMDAEAPDECHWMMRHSPLWAVFYDVPDYWAWLQSLPLDALRQIYGHYRLQVQQLQLFQRGIWVSKAFSHLHFLPVFYDVFPDARMVRLHRDPCAAVPSLCSVAQSYRSIFSTRVDPAAVGASLLEVFCDGMARAMALDRARPDVPAVDIHFDDLVADPVGTVRRVHESLGYPYEAGFERAMRDYLARSRAAPAYQHRYSLEQFGLTRAQVLDRSAEYLAWAAARCGKPLV